QLPRVKRALEPGHVEQEAKAAARRLDAERRAGECLVDGLLQPLSIADLPDRLKGSSQIAPLVAERRRPHADLRMPERPVRGRAEVMVEAPAQQLLPQCGKA